LHNNLGSKDHQDQRKQATPQSSSCLLQLKNERQKFLFMLFLLIIALCFCLRFLLAKLFQNFDFIIFLIVNPLFNRVPVMRLWVKLRPVSTPTFVYFCLFQHKHAFCHFLRFWQLAIHRNTFSLLLCCCVVQERTKSKLFVCSLLRVWQRRALPTRCV